MRLRTAAIGLALMGVTLGSAALTLGRARGAAWIGQPLELAVSAQLDAGQAANSLCAEADVFYADNRIEASRLQISVEAAPQPDTALIRIVSPSLVDEPVVTVYVRIGCGSKTSRRYVLLADYQSDTALTPTRTPEAPPVPAVAPAAASAVAPAAPQPTATTPPPAQSKAAAAPQPTTATARETPPPGAPARRKPAVEAKEPKEPKATPANRARLKLDPLENLAERIKTLEASSSAAPVEEMVRESQRMQQLQGDIKTLLEQAAKNEANLMAMRARLDRAESDRIPAWLLYALLGVVAACVAAIAVLWNRRDPSAWRSGLAAEPTPPARAAVATAAIATDDDDLDDTEAVTEAGLPKAAVPRKAQGRPRPDPLDMGTRSFESYVTVNAPLTASDSDLMPFGETANRRPNFNSSRMFDLCQQSEFFSKLGKTNEAIEALESRIRENSRDCPLIFMELLRVANLHSLKTDFRQFRDEFMTVFNVQVPEFALFRDEGRGLDGYPGVLSHITELWPSTQVMDVIEACVLISPGEKNAARFDLAAFRELILLHGIVYSLTQAQDPEAIDESDSEHVSLDL